LGRIPEAKKAEGAKSDDSRPLDSMALEFEKAGGAMRLPRWLHWRTNRELQQELRAHLDIETQQISNAAWRRKRRIFRHAVLSAILR